jgi:hypothetical protein
MNARSRRYVVSVTQTVLLMGLVLTAASDDDEGVTFGDDAQSRREQTS